MMVAYKYIIVRLMNKNIKITLSKNEKHKLNKLEEWYFKELKK